MKTIERSKKYAASCEEVFACLDDLSVTGTHMTRSSMPMMGGRMNLEFLSPNHTGPGTRYRWTGRVLWMDIDFTVEVTKWVKGKEKAWQTIGTAQMIIYSWFLMYLDVAEIPEGSRATLGISYEKPNGFFRKIICFLLGAWYAEWCLNNMLHDAGRKLEGRSFPSLKTM